MVKFELTMGGYQVFVDNEPIGGISREQGFFTAPTFVKKFMKVSVSDLRTISKKAQEVKEFGEVIPVCTSCNGTPYFPNEIHSPNEGMILCQSSLHPLKIR